MNHKNDLSELIEHLGTDAQIQKKFLENRKIFLWGAVTDQSSEDLINKLLYLEMVDPGKEITFYINSPGGVVTSGMAVYDTIQMITSPVATVCIGMAASMGSVLLAAGKKGRRFIWKNGTVLIHQPSIGGQITAPASDIKIHAQEILKTKAKLTKLLADACGRPVEDLIRDTDRDYYMNAEEAIEYGIVEHIATSIDV